MKKLAALLALTAVFLSACGNNTNSGDNGTTPSQISGTVNGVDYVLGLKNGRIGQLYPKS